MGDAMSEPIEVDDYLSGPEEMRRRELVWGVVREPPSPRYGHQSVVTRTTVLLDFHVRQHQLGVVCVSPMDVVLDAKNALIVQPDVLFVSNERAGIVREQIWGAPDLVVEVASPGTKRYDSATKIAWYRTYGVRECWLIDPHEAVVTVVNLGASRDVPRSFSGDNPVDSAVLPAFSTPAREFFE
jgi:Uma2 family endonuclease